MFSIQSLIFLSYYWIFIYKKIILHKYVLLCYSCGYFITSQLMKLQDGEKTDLATISSFCTWSAVKTVWENYKQGRRFGIQVLFDRRFCPFENVCSFLVHKIVRMFMTLVRMYICALQTVNIFFIQRLTQFCHNYSHHLILPRSKLCLHPKPAQDASFPREEANFLIALSHF